MYSEFKLKYTCNVLSFKVLTQYLYTYNLTNVIGFVCVAISLMLYSILTRLLNYRVAWYYNFCVCAIFTVQLFIFFLSFFERIQMFQKLMRHLLVRIKIVLTYSFRKAHLMSLT